MDIEALHALTQRITSSISDTCPISGVSIGRVDDKSTWRIDFEADATAEQRAAALAVLKSFDASRPTAEMVAAERKRRLAIGFDYDFGDQRGVHRIGTTEADLKGWGEVSTYAGALLDSGDTTTRIAIATDTGACEVTAAEWRAVEIAAAQFRQPIWARSFVLMQTLPMDYTADAHWA